MVSAAGSGVSLSTVAADFSYTVRMRIACVAAGAGPWDFAGNARARLGPDFAPGGAWADALGPAAGAGTPSISRRTTASHVTTSWEGPWGSATAPVCVEVSLVV